CGRSIRDLAGGRVKQHARTIIKAIRGGEVEALRAKLRTRGDAVQSGDDHCFHDIPGLHFLSCSILPQTEKRPGWYLAVELSFEGDVNRFFEWVVRYKGEAIDELLSSCVGYPGIANPREVARYLLDSTPAQAVYFGTPGRSRQQIAEEAGLRTRIARA